MKKVYTVLSCLFLLILLVVGITSIFTLDSSATKPGLTFAGLLDGSYSSGTRNFYESAFPQPEKLKNANARLNGFYRFSGFTGEDDVQLIIEMNSTAANGGAAAETPTEPKDNTAQSEAPVETTEAPTTVPENAVVEALGVVLLVGNRATEAAYANYDVLPLYAEATNKIADALGSGVRTFSMAVPNSAEFYTTADYHSGDCSQSMMIDYVYDRMNANVHTVDAYSKLAEHTNDYIYFRTDHHWTALGAYYAYEAFCQEAGFTPEPLSKFEKGQYDDFLGSLYNYLEDYPQSKVLKDDPDTVYFYRPFVDLDTKFYMDAELDFPYETGTLYNVSDNPNKYLCFIGGDHPITIIKTSADGPVCMLLKESYGNAFAPWLTSHYSKIIVIDPREFNRNGKPDLDLTTFAREQGVSDCIILNYPMMINSDSYVTWLTRLVEPDYDS